MTGYQTLDVFNIQWQFAICMMKTCKMFELCHPRSPAFCSDVNRADAGILQADPDLHLRVLSNLLQPIRQEKAWFLECIQAFKRADELSSDQSIDNCTV